MACAAQATERMDVTEQGLTKISKGMVIDHSVLVKDLDKISAKWEQFGVSLGVPFAELTKIRNNVSGRDSLSEFCFNRVIDAWLSGKKENLNKQFLVEAIRGVGGFKGLAEEIERKKLVISKKKPKAGPIVNALKSMKYKYSELGVQLEVDLGVIHQFEKHAGDVTRCLNETIYYWLHMDEGNGEDDQDEEEEEEEETESMKDTLFQALENVGHRGLAETLKKKYKGLNFPGEEEEKINTL